MFDKSARRDGTFERADLVYDHADDSYICPGGKRLRQRREVYREPRPFVDENGLMRYRASKLATASSTMYMTRPTVQHRKRPLRASAWKSPEILLVVRSAFHRLVAHTNDWILSPAQNWRHAHPAAKH